MMRISLALLALAACTPETTSFRSTDRGDGVDRGGPSSAAYTLRGASVHVWSNGGYIGTSDEPMTHVGFAILHESKEPVVFDGSSLQLFLDDKYGSALPAATFTTVTPLGPALVPVPAKTVDTLEAYFKLPVRPRVVNRMRVSWTLIVGGQRFDETTTFVRDDDFPVVDPPPQELRPPRAATR